MNVFDKTAWNYTCTQTQSKVSAYVTGEILAALWTVPMPSALCYHCTSGMQDADIGGVKRAQDLPAHILFTTSCESVVIFI